MRSLFYVALYKRPEISRICFEGLKRLVDGTEHDVFCVVSEKTSEDLCKEYGFQYEWVENMPVGRKLNLGLEKAMMFKSFDALVQVGSDDLLSPEIFDLHEQGINGSRKPINVDAKTKRVKTLDRGSLVGAGRMIPREVLDKMWCKLVGMTTNVVGPEPLRKGAMYWLPTRDADKLKKLGRADVMSDERLVVWPNDKNAGLDQNSAMRINQYADYGFTECWKNISLGIKSEANIWSYEAFPGEECELPDWISDKEREMILAL